MNGYFFFPSYWSQILAYPGVHMSYIIQILAPKLNPRVGFASPCLNLD